MTRSDDQALDALWQDMSTPPLTQQLRASLIAENHGAIALLAFELGITAGTIVAPRNVIFCGRNADPCHELEQAAVRAVEVFRTPYENQETGGRQATYLPGFTAVLIIDWQWQKYLPYRAELAVIDYAATPVIELETDAEMLHKPLTLLMDPFVQIAAYRVNAVEQKWET